MPRGIVGLLYAVVCSDRRLCYETVEKLKTARRGKINVGYFENELRQHFPIATVQEHEKCEMA